MHTKLSSRVVLGLAVSALFAGSAMAQTFKISLGVRESGVDVPIGGNGGATGGIEWINYDGQTLAADGNWHQLTWNFGTDSVTAFAGATANGTLDGTRGAIESIRFLNHEGVTDQITLLVDDVVNTVAGVPTVVQDFEAFNVGQEVMFRQPNFSGSTSGNFAGGTTSRLIDTAGHDSAKSQELKFTFLDNSPTRWGRFTTNNATNAPNPAIDFTAGNTLSMWFNASVPVQVIGWNTDSDGDWSDASKWAGTSADPTPNTNSEIARLLATTAPRTINVDQDFTINGININSPNTYTISGTGKLTLNSPTQSGIDGSLTVVAGNHVISAPLASRVRVAASIAAGTSLKTPGIIAEGATGEDFSDVLDFVKTGTGTFETGHLRFDVVTVSGGTVKLTADGTDAATSEVNSITFAGGTAPTAKLDLTNNSMIVDWDSTADPARPNAIFSIRARIVNGYNAGDWLGNGITSSSAAANSTYAIGYGDAATLALTEFGGRIVDGEATLIRYTRKGDHDLDRDVDFDDLLSLAQNYDAAYDPTGPGGPRLWSQGDFTYDGITNFDDLLALAQNYGSTALSADQLSSLGESFSSDWTLALSMVPEPASLSLIAGASMFLRRRR